jgi:hypothetical protein
VRRSYSLDLVPPFPSPAVLPELPQPRSGYGCNDHFHEPDTFEHSIEALIEIIAAANVSNPAMVVDVGLPYIHANVRYNCRCIFAGG